MAITTLLLAMLLSRGSAAARDVLANVRQAISAPSVNQPWPDTILSGSAVLNGVDGKYTLEFQPNGPFCQAVKGALGETFGYDGKTYWQIDRTGASRRLAFEDVDRTEALILVLTDRWLDPNSRANATVEPQGANAKSFRIHIQPQGTGLDEQITIDPTTWLPTSAEFEIASSKTVIDLSDWKQAGRMRLPFAAKVTNEGLTDSYTTNSATQGSNTEASIYAPPNTNLIDFTFDADLPAKVETKRTVTGHVLVHPLVNGKDVGWFILDSGAESMIIDPATADSLHLPKIGKEAVVGVGGTVQEAFRKADEFSLGPAVMKGVTFVEIDLHQLSDIFKVKLSGIVGYDFFRRFIVQLDISKPSVEIRSAATYRLPSGQWSEMLFSTGNPVVQATFEGGHKDWFRLDTGANGNVTFHAPAVERLHLLDNRRTTPANMAGVGGMTEARIGVLAWFELGGHRFEKVDTTFSLAKSGAFADKYLAGNIGQELMVPFTIVFDFGGSRVAFLPH